MRKPKAAPTITATALTIALSLGIAFLPAGTCMADDIIENTPSFSAFEQANQLDTPSDNTDESPGQANPSPSTSDDASQAHEPIEEPDDSESTNDPVGESPTYQAPEIWDESDEDAGKAGTDQDQAADADAASTADSPAATQTDTRGDTEAFAMGAVSFTDVSSGEWYSPYVEWAASEGLITGYRDNQGNPTGLFGPQDSFTRAQLATILWRNAGAPDAPSAGFSDTAGHWAKRAIDWCAQQGIITGYDGTGLFGPDDGITREQLCTMLWRNAGRPGGGIPLNRWVDGGWVSPFAGQAVAWAAGQGIMAGSVGNAQVLLLPQDGATRAEAAKMLAVALGGYLGTTPEHQVLKSIEGWWTTNGQRPINLYFHIHDGMVDRYDHNGTLTGTETLTENDIRWYEAGSFMNSKSGAGYAFLYNGGYRYICRDGSQIYAYGRGNSYSGSSSWSRSGALEG